MGPGELHLGGGQQKTQARWAWQDMKVTLEKELSSSDHESLGRPGSSFTGTKCSVLEQMWVCVIGCFSVAES